MTAAGPLRTQPIRPPNSAQKTIKDGTSIGGCARSFRQRQASRSAGSMRSSPGRSWISPKTTPPNSPTFAESISPSTSPGPCPTSSQLASPISPPPPKPTTTKTSRGRGSYVGCSAGVQWRHFWSSRGIPRRFRRQGG
jgi:hypothetical protein